MKKLLVLFLISFVITLTTTNVNAVERCEVDGVGYVEYSGGDWYEFYSNRGGLVGKLHQSAQRWYIDATAKGREGGFAEKEGDRWHVWSHIRKEWVGYVSGNNNLDIACKICALMAPDF